MLSKRHWDLLLGCILLLCLAGVDERPTAEDARRPSEYGLHRSGALRPALSVRLRGRSGAKVPFAAFMVADQSPNPRARRPFHYRLARVQLPVAFVGMAYFVCLGVWLCSSAGPAPSAPGGTAWSRGGHLGAGAFSLLPGLMAFGKAPWCVGCVAVHVVNLLLVAVVWVIGVASDAAPASQDSARTLVPTMLTAREAGTAILFAVLSSPRLFLPTGVVVHATT